jgi:DNA-3-methyladenine glycosylase II
VRCVPAVVRVSTSPSSKEEVKAHLSPRPSSSASAPATLTAAGLADALQFLAARDATLARILKDFGPPPMWEREPGFATLLYIILEQLVSLASAKATFERLLAILSPLTPERFLELDDATLRSIGFSRQKTASTRNLARAILAGDLDLDGLRHLSDDEARARLMMLKGIGPWTADIYLLRVLNRPDVFPVGDRALVLAAQSINDLKTFPTAGELELIAENWRPWRAAAARLLWHYYLHRRAGRQQKRD